MESLAYKKNEMALANTQNQLKEKNSP